MARRRDISNEKLSEADLVVLRKRLAIMSSTDLEMHYKASHNACRYNPLRAPQPAVLQEFVQVWKQLRRMKKR